VTAPLAVEERPSPNHGPRAPGKALDMLILHYTGMEPADAALRWLTMERSQVSSHYFVFEDGRIVRLVPEDRRAWHAGVSCWQGETDINSRSIGIEIANPGHDFGYRDFPEPQIEAVIALCRDISTRNAIPPWRVLAHSDVAPLRKKDPGERFPWARLATAGVGAWVEPPPAADGPVLRAGAFGGEVRALQRSLAAYGYDVADHGVFDLFTETVVAAFQRHFRPARIDGAADGSTLETLARLTGRAATG
jgi:N-acetylmuramoyl-L-alanine amidase